MAGSNGSASRRQQNTRNNVSHKQARILWPALGFPEVLSAGGGDAASGKICVLFLCEVPPAKMTPEIVARHLRCVPWAQRHTRYQDPRPDNSFLPSQISVQEVPVVASDALNEQLHFFSGRVRVGLAKAVRNLYRQAGLPYLYEARISTANETRDPFAGGSGGNGATGSGAAGGASKLAPGRYQLLWINRRRSDTEQDPSDEMRLLVERHAKRARFGSDGVPQYKHLEKTGVARQYLAEYEFDYDRKTGMAGRERTEVLHPLFVLPPGRPAQLSVGHLTDMHVDLRIDRLKEALAPAAQRRYNNFNDNFAELYADARQHCDLLLMTGDLIDYGRGYHGRMAATYDESGRLKSRRHEFGKDRSYWRDRNWFLFYAMLASGEQTYARPVYTILGNHDWRLNPYHSLASNGPPPKDYGLSRDELDAAHGPTEGGHGGNNWYGPDTMDSTPLYTTVDSVKWYLLLINPFLDYLFNFPGNYPILMLDWANNERVIISRDEHPDPDKIKRTFVEDVLAKANRTQAPSPIARDALAPVQKNLTEWFAKEKGKGKILGIHAPLIGPYAFWTDAEMLQPQHAIDANFADHGSIGKHRAWLLNRLVQAKVRIVATGHIHRTNVFVLYASSQYPAPLAKAIDPVKAGQYDWPLMLNTTSMGPPGTRSDKSAAPAYAIARLSASGRVTQVAYRTKGKLSQPLPAPPPGSVPTSLRMRQPANAGP